MKAKRQAILASEIVPGDVLAMAVGPTLVVRTAQTHGGIECRVARSGDSPFLWFWPQEMVRRLRNDQEALTSWLADADRRLAAFRERVGSERAKAADPSCSETDAAVVAASRREEGP